MLGCGWQWGGHCGREEVGAAALSWWDLAGDKAGTLVLL